MLLRVALDVQAREEVHGPGDLAEELGVGSEEPAGSEPEWLAPDVLAAPWWRVV